MQKSEVLPLSSPEELEKENNRLKIAIALLNHLIEIDKKQKFGKQETTVFNNKKLFYEIVFCLQIIGECLKVDSLSNSYKEDQQFNKDYILPIGNHLLRPFLTRITHSW